MHVTWNGKSEVSRIDGFEVLLDGSFVGGIAGFGI